MQVTTVDATWTSKLGNLAKKSLGGYIVLRGRHKFNIFIFTRLVVCLIRRVNISIGETA